MRSPPGSLLVLRRVNIYHPAMSTDLWSDSNPWGIGSNLFDTMAPVGLVERAAVSVESDVGGGGRSMLCTKRQKYPFLLAINVRPRERFVKAPLVQYCLSMVTTRTACNLQECDCCHL